MTPGVPAVESLELPPCWRVASAEAPEVPGPRLTLRLHPGEGFGRGSHGTTRLCLNAVGRFAPPAGAPPWRMLDFGSGTGILALAAARLGAAAVDAVEIDETALAECARNAELNGLADRIRAVRSLEHAPGRYELVVANILRPVLLAHAGSLVERLAPGGTLVLSGLLAPEVPEVEVRYARELGGRGAEVYREGDWRALAWRLARPVALALAVATGASAWLALAPRTAEAVILPYVVRTRNFSSWTPATRGDTNTIGMAGATVATPTTISAAEANPAGFGMVTGSVSAQINQSTLDEPRLQRSKAPIESSQWGLGVTPGSWGASLAYYSPQTESGIYVSPNSGDAVSTEVSLKELRLTLAGVTLGGDLALGVSLEGVKAVRELDDASASAGALSYRAGALYRFPHHILLGASFAPEITVGPAVDPDPQAVMPGFNRAVVRPMLGTVGAGWIPNRFFKFGASVTYAGATANTALLADERVMTGAFATFVPRFGAAYVLAEWANFKVETALGAYFERTRQSDRNDRWHFTGGLEANPYFMNLGASVDFSRDFRNLNFSVGIDIVRTARAFNIIPADPVPPYRGRFPPPFEESADGLPMGLTGDEPRRYRSTGVGDVSKIIENVPDNIAKKVSGEQTDVEEQQEEARQRPPAPPSPLAPSTRKRRP